MSALANVVSDQVKNALHTSLSRVCEKIAHLLLRAGEGTGHRTQQRSSYDRKGRAQRRYRSLLGWHQGIISLYCIVAV